MSTVCEAAAVAAVRVYYRTHSLRTGLRLPRRHHAWYLQVFDSLGGISNRRFVFDAFDESFTPLDAVVLSLSRLGIAATVEDVEFCTHTQTATWSERDE